MHFYDPKIHDGDHDWFVGHSKDIRKVNDDYLGTPSELRDAIEDFILGKSIEKAKLQFDAIVTFIDEIAWIEGDSFEDDIHFLTDAPVFYEVDDTEQLARVQAKTEYEIPSEICELFLQVFRTYTTEDRLNALRCTYWYAMSWKYPLIDFESLLGQMACQFGVVCDVNASMDELWRINFQLNKEHRRKAEV